MFDFVVVGAGSAGCVLAARLSAAGRRVCLIEAGGPHHIGGNTNAPTIMIAEKCAELALAS